MQLMHHNKGHRILEPHSPPAMSFIKMERTYMTLIKSFQCSVYNSQYRVSTVQSISLFMTEKTKEFMHSPFIGHMDGRICLFLRVRCYWYPCYQEDMNIQVAWTFDVLFCNDRQIITGNNEPQADNLPPYVVKQVTDSYAVNTSERISPLHWIPCICMPRLYVHSSLYICWNWQCRQCLW